MGADNNIQSLIKVNIKEIDWVNWLSNHMTVNLTADSTVKCRYNAVFGVQEIDRVIAVTAL